jgi:hypothetical protein
MADEVKAPEQMNTDELLAAIEKESITATGAPVVEAPPPEIEVKLATGQVYKGKDYAEVVDKLKAAQEHASIAIRDREAQLKQLREQLSTMPQPTSQPASDKFDKAHYYKLLEDNPIEAQDYIDGYRPNAKQAYETVTRVNRMMEVNQFLQMAKDYPNTDENAQLLEAKVSAMGRPMTSDNMFIAYHTLRNEGAIKPIETEQASYKPPTPPPPLGGTGAQSTPDLIAQVDRMTDAELESLLRKKGLL